jgi:hypothetical protein
MGRISAEGISGQGAVYVGDREFAIYYHKLMRSKFGKKESLEIVEIEIPKNLREKWSECDGIQPPGTKMRHSLGKPQVADPNSPGRAFGLPKDVVYDLDKLIKESQIDVRVIDIIEILDQ